MALSPNYSWSEPDNSSLVKNGASDIRTLGDAIDTSVWNVGFGQAGKNKIINGDFGIWQRGTSFTNPAVGSFFADRWRINNLGASVPTTYSVEQQTFTPGTAPLAGYEGTFFARSTITTVGSNSAYDLAQRIEDVRTFANQTITVSFWAKADSARTTAISIIQNFGSGGSTAVTVVNFTPTFSLTTSWQRFTLTVAIPSISGKTLGSGNFLALIFRQASASGSVLDLWGVQVEYGSKATPFQTATGTLQGELAACQRYYFRTTGALTYLGSGGIAGSTTQCYVQVKHPTTMRIAPATLDYSLLLLQIITGSTNVTSASISSAQPDLTLILANVASGLTATTQSYMLMTQNNSTAYLGLSAEL